MFGKMPLHPMNLKYDNFLIPSPRESPGMLWHGRMKVVRPDPGQDTAGPGGTSPPPTTVTAHSKMGWTRAETRAAAAA